jgi:hypothetical protein
MTVSPFPIPKQLRQSDIFVGNGGAVYSGFNFKIFDIGDVEVWTKAGDDDAFELRTAVVAKVNGLPFDDFTVTFSVAQPVTTQILVRSARLDERSAGVINGTRLDPNATEKEFSKISTEMQELRRDVDRAVHTDFGAPSFLPIPFPDPNKPIVWRQDGRGFENGAETYNGLRGRVDQEVRDRIAGDLALAGLIGQAGPIEVPWFDTDVAVMLANIKPTIGTIMTGGCQLPGDGGHKILRRADSEPAHSAKLKSLNGIWFELTGTVIRAEQFAAFNDGVDRTTAAQAALDYLKYRGGGRLEFLRAGPSYLITSLLGSDNIEIHVGQGVTVQHNPLATASMIKATGSKGVQSAITATVAALDTSVPVADASGFAAGDWVILKDTTDYSTDSAAIGYKSGESLVIKSISGNTLNFDRKIFGSWQSDFTYTVARGGNVQKVIPVRNFRVTGPGTLVGFQTQNISLVEMAYTDGARFLEPNYNTFAGAGVLYRTCRNIEHKPGNVADGRNDTVNGFPGYGVALWGACDVGRVYGGYYTRTRHAFTTMGSLDGGPSRIYVTGNIVFENDFTGLDTHEGTHEITIDDNKVYGGNAATGAGGINSRSPTTRIIDNEVVGVPGNGISAVGMALRSLRIEGNTVEDCDGSGIAVSSTVRGLYIFDNVVKNSGLHGISCLGVSYDTGISRVNVAGNKVFGWGRLLASRSGIQIVTTTASAGYIDNNIVDATNGTEGRGIYISAAALTGSVSNNKLRGTYTIAPLPIPISMLGDGNEWDGAPNFQRVTIPIDGFYFLPGVTTGFQQITIGTTGSGGNQPNGIFAARVSATPGIIAVSTFSANVILTTGTLNGSTGTTGNFTISAGTTGVYFENRTTAAITVTIQTKNRL